MFGGQTVELFLFFSFYLKMGEREMKSPTILQLQEALRFPRDPPQYIQGCCASGGSDLRSAVLVDREAGGGYLGTGTFVIWEQKLETI